MKNALTKSEPKPVKFGEYLADVKVKQWINGVIGSEKEAQKFISSVTSAITTNPQLQICDNKSIISSALLANALDLSLSPSLGLAYMVPFEDKKNARTVATFILGYKGYIQLAVRSGKYRKINVTSIKEGEFVSYNPLTEELTVNFITDDEVREKAPTVGYYAYFELVNGFTKSLYWSKKKMLMHADRYSKAFNLEAKNGKASYADYAAGKVDEKELWKYSSFWYKDFDAMAFKTMLRQLISKWGIMSIDMQTAFEADEKDSDAGEIEPEFTGAESPNPSPVPDKITLTNEAKIEDKTNEEFDEEGFFEDDPIFD